jgi:chemotaxis protein methyltransferase CheR
MELLTAALTAEQFERFAQLVYRRAGIYLPPEKRTLLSNRLRRRVRALNLPDYDAYYEAMTDPARAAEEMPHFLSAITTNETYFFRNQPLWDTLRDVLIPEWTRTKPVGSRSVRIWSAASSSGEEAYTAALVLRESLPDFARWQVQIVGTDISDNVLTRARAGVYNDYALSKTPPAIRDRWFRRASDGYQLAEPIRRLVRFQFHNLRDPFPGGGFDFVLLRNVLMYFDTGMKKRAIQVTSAAVAPGGYLYIGDVDPTRTTAELSAAMTLTPLSPGLYRKPPRTAGASGRTAPVKVAP